MMMTTTQAQDGPNWTLHHTSNHSKRPFIILGTVSIVLSSELVALGCPAGLLHRFGCRRPSSRRRREDGGICRGQDPTAASTATVQDPDPKALNLNRLNPTLGSEAHPKTISGGAVKPKVPGSTPSQGGARPVMSNMGTVGA